ncbi:MAG: YcgN family cysteine cluster protein [Pseudomonadota bacterium]|jgi:uncharacterized cysteine cluster protein YcgN (CxxCxxCC family)
MAEVPFWRAKALAELSQAEWESLCDGCGKCCLHKLEDEDTGEILYTRVACRLLDIAACRCTGYQDRFRLVPDCMDLRQVPDQFHWLPASCAYRLLGEDKDLPEWHPLVSGRDDSVHLARKSVREFAISETGVDCIEDHVVEGLGDAV